MFVQNMTVYKVYLNDGCLYPSMDSSPSANLLSRLPVALFLFSTLQYTNNDEVMIKDRHSIPMLMA